MRCVFFFFPDDGRTKPMPRKGHTESFEPADNKCLIRASDGKKKISTVVSLLCFICLFNILKCFFFSFMLLMLNSCFLIAGQHQRSNQVSDGRWSYSQSQPCLGASPLATLCRYSWLDLTDVMQRLPKHHLLLIINLNFSSPGIFQPP